MQKKSLTTVDSKHNSSKYQHLSAPSPRIPNLANPSHQAALLQLKPPASIALQYSVSERPADEVWIAKSHEIERRLRSDTPILLHRWWQFLHDAFFWLLEVPSGNVQEV